MKGISTISFGNIRSWMQKDCLTAEERELIWLSLKAKYDSEPGTYRTLWLPYLQSFSHHFKQVWITLENVNDLELATVLLPQAHFGLNLSNQRLYCDDVRRISNLPALNQVAYLDLSRNNFCVRGLQAISESRYVGAVKKLNVSETLNPPIRKDAIVLAKSCQLRSLEYLVWKELLGTMSLGLFLMHNKLKDLKTIQNHLGEIEI